MLYLSKTVKEKKTLPARNARQSSMTIKRNLVLLGISPPFHKNLPHHLGPAQHCARLFGFRKPYYLAAAIGFKRQPLEGTGQGAPPGTRPITSTSNLSPTRQCHRGNGLRACAGRPLPWPDCFRVDPRPFSTSLVFQGNFPSWLVI